MSVTTLWIRLQRPLILLAMQSCWLYAWVSTIELASIGHRAIAATTVLLLVIGVAWRQLLARLVKRRIPAELLYWILLPIVAALAAKIMLFPDSALTQSDWLLALPRALAYVLYETRTAELLLSLGSAAAWYLGSRLTTGPVSYERLLGQFQLGIVMLFTALLVSYGFESLLPRAGLLVVCFFAVALTGISSARSAEQRASNGGPSHITTSVVTLVVMVSGIGILIGAIATPGLIDTLIGAAKYVTHLLGEAVAYVASLIPQPEYTPAEPEVSSTGDDSALREFYKSLPVSAILRRALFIGWLAIVLGLLFIALWRLCSVLLERLRRLQAGSGEERESLDSGLLADLVALFLALQNRVDTLVRRLRTAIQQLSGKREPASARTVYLRFSSWAGKRVARREPWQSPHEYMRVLATLIPEATPDLSFVTESYVQARYGVWTPDPDTVDQMAQATKRIRKARRTRPHSIAQEGLEW